MKWYVFGCILALALMNSATAQTKASGSYPAMAPLGQYLISNPQDEIALARSAAPPSISSNADVLVLGSHGYETAVKGNNGFVCFVERSWASRSDDPEFWNPKERAPNCYNPPAVRSQLPQYLKRTQWVLAGASKQQLFEKIQSGYADHSFLAPERGSMSFMLSKNGYLNDDAAGPWLPHVMFFIPQSEEPEWGAGLEGSPVVGQDRLDSQSTVVFIPVRRWSDGSPGPPPVTQHAHT